MSAHHHPMSGNVVPMLLGAAAGCLIDMGLTIVSRAQKEQKEHEQLDSRFHDERMLHRRAQTEKHLLEQEVATTTAAVVEKEEEKEEDPKQRGGGRRATHHHHRRRRRRRRSGSRQSDDDDDDDDDVKKKEEGEEEEDDASMVLVGRRVSGEEARQLVLKGAAEGTAPVISGGRVGMMDKISNLTEQVCTRVASGFQQNRGGTSGGGNGGGEDGKEVETKDGEASSLSSTTPPQMVLDTTHAANRAAMLSQIEYVGAVEELEVVLDLLSVVYVESQMILSINLLLRALDRILCLRSQFIRGNIANTSPQKDISTVTYNANIIHSALVDVRKGVMEYGQRAAVLQEEEGEERKGGRRYRRRRRPPLPNQSDGGGGDDDDDTYIVLGFCDADRAVVCVDTLRRVVEALGYLEKFYEALVRGLISSLEQT